MYPSLMIEEIAYERAAELQRSASKSRSARAVALAARQQDVLARRRMWGLLPDRPIVTAKPIRPRTTSPQPVPAVMSAPTAADADAPVAVLTGCR